MSVYSEHITRLSSPGFTLSRRVLSTTATIARITQNKPDEATTGLARTLSGKGNPQNSAAWAQRDSNP